MPDLNRIIIKRLLLAWMMVSLLIGTGVFLIESARIDDAVIALAETESQTDAKRFSLEEIGLKNATPADLITLNQLAAEAVRKNYVEMKGYDAAGTLLFEAANPTFERLRLALPKDMPLFPADNAHHVQKLAVAGETVVQLQIPLKTEAGRLAGHIEAIFVVQPEDLARLDAELRRFLIIALLCIACTTLALYPVILSLNRRVVRFSDKVIKGNLEIVTVLGAAIAERDSDTGDHNYRVTLYAIRLAEAIGIQRIDMRALILGAFLHDVGKIGIRDNILLKPASLSADETTIMRTHVQLGVGIIQTSEWLQAARDVIECHHERYDGSGYLKGLRGENIPLTARIFAIVDVFDALTSKRPYKEAWTVETAISMLEKDAGTHFDPQLVQVFKHIAADLYGQFGQSNETELNAVLRKLVKLHYFKLIAQSEGQ